MSMWVVGEKIGAKNGKPWMWSQCVWLRRSVRRTGFVASAMSSLPSSRAPVPQSITKRTPAFVVTSTHAVLPPNRAVRGPGEAIEPRVPQKCMRMGLGGAGPELEHDGPQEPAERVHLRARP